MDYNEIIYEKLKNIGQIYTYNKKIINCEGGDIIEDVEINTRNQNTIIFSKCKNVSLEKIHYYDIYENGKRLYVGKYPLKIINELFTKYFNIEFK